jgi:hypothetical protein
VNWTLGPWTARRSREVASLLLLVLLAWIIAVATGWQQQWPNDFSAFYFAARGLVHFGFPLTRDLYSLPTQYALEAAVKGRGGSLAIPFVNPPIAAWAMLAFSYLPLRAAFWCWDAVGLVGCAGGLWWILRQHPDIPGLSLVALGALASYPTYIALGQGQFDLLWPLGAALAMSAATMARACRWVPRAASSALFLALKPDLFLGLVVPGLSRWRNRRVQVFALALLALGLGTFLDLGVAGIRQAIHLETYTLVERFPPTNDVTALGFFWRLFGPGSLASTLGLLMIPLGLALQALAWARRPPRSEADWWWALTSSLCLSLLIAPHDLTQGLLLLAPAAVWSGVALRSQGRPLTGLALWMLALNLAALLDLSPHLDLPIKATPLVLAAAAVVAWRQIAQETTHPAEGTPREGALPLPN